MPGEEGSGGGELHQEVQREFPGSRLTQVLVDSGDVVELLRVPSDDPGCDKRADLVKAETEARDRPEVPAAPSQRPEQAFMLVGGSSADLAVGGHDLDLVEVVDGPAELSAQVAETSAEGEPGHARERDEAEHGRKSVGLRAAVDVAEAAPRADVSDAASRVDFHPAQSRHIEGESAVGE